MEKQVIFIDFETRSTVDLPKHGLYRYARHESTEVLMMAYAVDNGPVHLWCPPQEPPAFCSKPEDFIIVAHNAEFEEAIWNNVCTKMGWARLPISSLSCTMSVAGRYGLPQSLDKCGEVLSTQHKKNPEGYSLIKHFCIPPFGEPRGDKWERFKQYCKEDVETERAIFHALPKPFLDKEERWVWEETLRMNQTGIPVDYKAAKQIRRVCEAYREAHYELLPELTGGAITKITQVQRIVKYCHSRGIEIPDCTSATVQEYLERGDLPDDVMQLLEMRAAIGMSSIGKYIRFEEMSYEGRAYYNQWYYGAHTGRWTGTGIQLLNLPRAKVSDPEAEIEAFFDGSIVERNPIKSARALIRPMIAPKKGKVLIVADYSAIEYVLLEWFAENQKGLDRFAAGYDQYVDQASAMYKVPYSDVSDDQRRSGKIVVLGCGYGQGANKLVITASTQWGLKISEEEASFMVQGYRKEHRLAVKLWYELLDGCITAIKDKGSKPVRGKCSFQVSKDRTGVEWLIVTLPSRRKLYYRQPFLEPGPRGLTPSYWGFNRVIKQWCVQYIIPGRITENVVQAAARDILVDCLRRINSDFNVIWTVYDEIICEEDDEGEGGNTALLESLCHAMSQPPDWCKGLPLRAEGYFSYRYKKG